MLSLGYCGLIMSIFCFGVSLAVSDEMKEMAKMLHDSCVEETGVDEGLIDKANSGDFAEDNKLKNLIAKLLKKEENGTCVKHIECSSTHTVDTSDVQFLCYMKCLMEQVSAMTDEGEIDGEVIISMLPEEMVDVVAPVIRSCGTVKGADDCDTVFQTQKCYHSKNPEKYFLL